VAWMFLHTINLTTALRPSLLPDETLLFVQDGVGLYQGFVRSQLVICQAVLNLSLLTCFQEIQDTRVSEWPRLPDLAASMLC
jgi:hypothetical protein